MDSISHSAATTSVMDEHSNIVIPSKRDLFLSTYQPHQPWSLPDSIIYYISRNPSTSKVYQKLIQSCKYFFNKNPIVIVQTLFLCYEKNGWKTLLNRKEIDLKNINCKIWITDFVGCDNTAKNGNDQYFATSIFPKIFQSGIKNITIMHQNIAFNDLIVFASKCETAIFFNVTVLNENGSAVAVEKIVEVFPFVKEFHFLRFSNANVITSKTAKNLIKISNFAKLEFFELLKIPECFDIDTFFSYIKKNKNTKIRLLFSQIISEQYRNRLQAIVNEIIQAENRDYRPAFIHFPGIDESSFLKLCKLFKSG